MWSEVTLVSAFLIPFRNGFWTSGNLLRIGQNCSKLETSKCNVNQFDQIVAVLRLTAGTYVMKHSCEHLIY